MSAAADRLAYHRAEADRRRATARGRHEQALAANAHLREHVNYAGSLRRDYDANRAGADDAPVLAAESARDDAQAAHVAAQAAASSAQQAAARVAGLVRRLESYVQQEAQR